MSINKDYRYKVAPQLKDYDNYLSHKYLPYIMFVSKPNIKSKTINTDNKGFRLNNNKKNKTIFENLEKKETILFLGNCCTFGIGYSTDETTISGNLEKELEYNFINLSASGFTGFQEILSVFTNFEELKKLNLKKIITISGFNDPFLSNLNETEYPGKFYFSNKYKRKINTSEKSSSKLLGLLFYYTINFFLAHRIEKKNLYKLKIKDIFEILFKKEKRDQINSNEEYVMQSIDEIISRNIKIYKSFENIFNCKVIFALQPVLKWCKKLTDEENSLVEYTKLYLNKTNRAVDNFINQKNYDLIVTKYKNQCKTNNIEFFDLNEEIKKQNLSNQSIFVDNLHMNDRGYKLSSDIIKNLILKFD